MRYASRAIITIAVVVFISLMQASSMFDIALSKAVPVGLFPVMLAALLYFRTRSAIKAGVGYILGLLVVAVIMYPIKEILVHDRDVLLSSMVYVFAPSNHYSLLLINLLPISKAGTRRQKGSAFVGIVGAIITAVIVGVIEMFNEKSFYSGHGMERALKGIGYDFWISIVPVGIAAYAFNRMHSSLRSEEYSKNTDSAQMTTLDSQF